MVRICDFTARELSRLKVLCNFTPQEERLFDLRSKEYTLEECADVMHTSISTVKRLHTKIKEKISRI